MTSPKAAERSDKRFDTHFFRSMPATWGLVASFVLMHAIATWLDRHERYDDVVQLIFADRTDATLTLLGGRAHALVARGQIWRLLTCGFLHHDGLHLFLNATAMWGLGERAEAVWGSARLLLLFLLSVAGGALLSQMGGGALSIGASGGVFGVMGALVAFAWRRRRVLSPFLRMALGRELVPWIGINLAVGAVVPAIDNLGHLGGLLTGLVVAYVFGDRITDNGEDTPGRRALWVILAWGLLVMVLLGIPLSVLLG